MPPKIAHVTFDCTDAARTAQFWSQLLDRPVDDGATPYFATVGRAVPGRTDPVLMFIQVPEAKQAKNRQHLDLHTEDWDAERARIGALGATEVGEHREFGAHWVTFLDPDGHEFCLGEPWSG